MHSLIINFNIQGISHEQYAEACDSLAATFAEIPGLISKQWLANEATNTYGGVYLWRDQQSMEAFKNSELFSQVENNPAFTNVTATDFGILDGPSKVTGVG